MPLLWPLAPFESAMSAERPIERSVSGQVLGREESGGGGTRRDLSRDVTSNVYNKRMMACNAATISK